MMDDSLTFEDLLNTIQQAQLYIESETNEDFADIVDSAYETLEFTVGHVMGMRDCLILVQSIIQRSMFPEVKTEEE